jgi:hypothetical protein
MYVIRMAIKSQPFAEVLRSHNKRWTSSASALPLTVGPVPAHDRSSGTLKSARESRHSQRGGGGD